MRKLAIIAAQRSGTHALASVLEANGFQQMDEIFMEWPFGDDVRQKANFRAWLSSQPLSAIEYLRRQDETFTKYLNHLDSLTDGPYQVDIKYNSLHTMQRVFQEPTGFPALLKLMHDLEFTFIHLRRRNSFLQIMSETIGNQTGDFHHYAHSDVNARSITADIGLFTFRLEQVSQSAAIASEWMTRAKAIELVYEDAFSGGSLSLDAKNRLSKGGIEIADAQPATVKPERDLRKMISNIDDLLAAVDKTRFADMIPPSLRG